MLDVIIMILAFKLVALVAGATVVAVYIGAVGMFIVGKLLDGFVVATDYIADRISR